MIVCCLPSRGLINSRTLESITKEDVKLIYTHDLPLPDSRIHLVDEALKLKPTHLWFVDDDIVVPDGWLKKALAKKKPVVVADYLLQTGERATQGDYFGLGCVLIEASVFKKLTKPYFRTDFKLIKQGSMVKEVFGKEKEWGGEDIYFAHLLKKAGIKITHFGVCDHLRIRSWGEKYQNKGAHKITPIKAEKPKITAYVHMYPPIHNAGAEHYLHRTFKYLTSKGFECQVYLPNVKPYEYDGIKVTNKLEETDIILTHLDKSAQAEEYAKKNGLPLVHLIHNDSAPKLIKYASLVVYNTEWVRECSPTIFDSIVLHPPIQRVDAVPGDCITLINLFKQKGTDLAFRLAKKLPDQKFLFVRGAYGKQEIPPKLANVEVIDNQTDIAEVYKRTKILLTPSLYESYGMCAVEASLVGIPVIANSTPGLKEALGPFGTFPGNHIQDWISAIKKIDSNYKAYSEMARRVESRLKPNLELMELEKKLLCL